MHCSKLFFTARIITKYSLERFFSIFGEKLSKGLLKFGCGMHCSKLFFTARIITKYSLERFLSIFSEKLSKGLLKFCNLISNLIKHHKLTQNSVSFSCQSKQDSRCCINFPHELTCQILTNQSIKIGRRA